MTPDQYRAAIKALGLSQAAAAKFLDVSLRTSHAYANGQPIPYSVELLLRTMIKQGISPDAHD